MMLTPQQMRIAADICDARKFEMTRDSTPDEVAAGAWVFDHGIFYMGESGCAEAAKMLRAEADKSEATK
jgi:hypothetical protein